jgi:hypothetical protein
MTEMKDIRMQYSFSTLAWTVVASQPRKKSKKRPKPKAGDNGSNDGTGNGAANLREVLDLGDLPERLSDTAGYGNMPELTLLLEDDAVIDRFEVRGATSGV